MLKRGLGEQDVAVGDALENVKCVVPVLPAVTEIDGHLDAISDHAAAPPDQVDQLPVRDEIEEQDLHLDRPEAGIDGRLELAFDFLHQLFDAAAVGEARIDGAIGPELVPPGAAEQFVGGHAQLFARQVVDRNVQGRDGVDAQSPPSRPEGALVELLPQGRCFERIGTDEYVGSVPAPQMRGRHLKEVPDDVGWRIRFPDAEAPVLVNDFHDYGIGGAVQIAR